MPSIKESLTAKKKHRSKRV